jgi:hypothetical protein
VVFPEKVIVNQMVKKYPALMKPGGSFTKAHHWNVFWERGSSPHCHTIGKGKVVSGL